jgi:hypothetical protein
VPIVGINEYRWDVPIVGINEYRWDVPIVGINEYSWDVPIVDNLYCQGDAKYHILDSVGDIRSCYM